MLQDRPGQKWVESKVPGSKKTCAAAPKGLNLRQKEAMTGRKLSPKRTGEN